MCVDLNIRLICHFLFCFELYLFYRTVYCSNCTYFLEQYIVRVLFESQKKYLAYTESIGNIRLKVISKKRRDRGWVLPVRQVGDKRLFCPTKQEKLYFHLQGL